MWLQVPTYFAVVHEHRAHVPHGRFGSSRLLAKGQVWSAEGGMDTQQGAGLLRDTRLNTRGL